MKTKTWLLAAALALSCAPALAADQVGYAVSSSNPNTQAVSPQNPLPVTTSTPGPGTGATSQVGSSASAVTILAANASRKGATIVNDSTAVLYLILSSTTPTSSVYTVALDAKGTVGAYFEVPFGYSGIIKGLWASANGNAIVTEFQ